MPAREFPLNPEATIRIETAHRRIQTPLPVPESLPILERLRLHETRSMRGQPPVLWHRAQGCRISDAHGNCWLDWSSGVLVANAGHGHPKIKAALHEYLDEDRPLMTYCFPHEARARLVEKLIEVSPPELDRVFLLTTGSEATEVAIKLARTHGIRKNPRKRYMVTFEGAFHGRTYGAQIAGGILGGSEWVDPNPHFVQVPFPGSIEVADKRFSAFEKRLAELGVEPDLVAGVMAETFQGREARLMPAEYAQALRAWCDRHGAALIFDEVQAGFGRTGRMFAFEHYGIVPDMACCGKGISSSLPLSAVIGRSDYLDLYGPGEMTSTHTGSPLPVVSGLANIEALMQEGLIENAALQGAWLLGELEKITAPWRGRIEVGGIGLVVGMLFFGDRATLTPDADLAFQFCKECFLRGNLFFAPVGRGQGTIKFCPPLCITREELEDGLYGPHGIRDVLESIMAESTVGGGVA